LLTFIFSWKKVFVDPESTVDYFMWAIGSQPGYDDIMAFTKEETECGQNGQQNPLDLKEGHAYYISVKVSEYTHIIILHTTSAQLSLNN
jgi:hypothetical protein